MISRTEAKYINKSLTFLEQVIISLYDKSQGQRVHVPYRNSLMTSILRDSLGGNCRTAMIANLSSNLRDEEETISTGRFALRCQKLTNVVFKNQRQEDSSTLEKLQKENLSLREQITQQELFIT
jgi:kinesin family protein 6/9